jgi:hypothetical protein
MFTSDEIEEMFKELEESYWGFPLFFCLCVKIL